MVSTPFFLDTPAGRIFAIHHQPAPGQPVRGHVLLAPPFNEEMNRCRSMVTLQAQALASIGYGTLVPDLLGTGDSEGEHVDGRWSAWLDNLAAAKAWLDSQPGGCQVLWGIRLGAALAVQLHAQLADGRIGLLLWQPVADGKTHLTQFFRVRIAAAMDRPDLPKETASSMRASLAAGMPVEVAGYALHPELTAAIDDVRLAGLVPAAGARLLWLENTTAERPDLTPATQTLLARWPGPACQVSAQGFHGPAFWQMHERVVAPAVIEQSTTWVGQGGAAQ